MIFKHVTIQRKSFLLFESIVLIFLDRNIVFQDVTILNDCSFYLLSAGQSNWSKKRKKIENFCCYNFWFLSPCQLTYFKFIGKSMGKQFFFTCCIFCNLRTSWFISNIFSLLLFCVLNWKKMQNSVTWLIYNTVHMYKEKIATESKDIAQKV